MIEKGNLGRIRLKGKGMSELRRKRFEMDGYRCTVCGCKVFDDAPDCSPYRAELDHVKSRGAFGPDTIENTVTKCRQCHWKEHNPKTIRRK